MKAWFGRRVPARPGPSLDARDDGLFFLASMDNVRNPTGATLATVIGALLGVCSFVLLHHLITDPESVTAGLRPNHCLSSGVRLH